MIFKKTAQRAILRVIATTAVSIFTALSAFAATQTTDTSELLIKLAQPASQNALLNSMKKQGAVVEPLFGNWVRVTHIKSTRAVALLKNSPSVVHVQKNYTLKMFGAKSLAGMINPKNDQPVIKPELPSAQPPVSVPMPDPLMDKQWGLKDIGVDRAWSVSKGTDKMIVAVIDTGVDYTHEDLVSNIWRNPGETGIDANGKDKSNNQIDDDANGYVDDVIGWDFAQNDNKPFDITTPPAALLGGEGNPGHGTHCAGTIAASADNGKGISGIAPNARIMPLRFITEKGQGTTADAVKAVKYAVDNGAKVLSNSWGSEGDDPSDANANQALRDVIKYAMDHGVLFIAAAGNGHQGVGYDNDTDSAPGVPASYPIDNIISVAAIDVNGQLGAFSNWGAKTVHIGAPGVDVFSTMVGNNYNDKVLDIAGFTANWDGTSMAAPHVAGAAALYWSAHPEKTWREVKDVIITSAKRIDSMKGKAVSEGKLDVGAMFGK